MPERCSQGSRGLLIGPINGGQAFHLNSLAVTMFQMAQNNADVHPFGVDVTVVEGTILHLIIPDHNHLVPFTWMNASVFGASWVNTGAVITSTYRMLRRFGVQARYAQEPIVSVNSRSIR